MAIFRLVPLPRTVPLLAFTLSTLLAEAALAEPQADPRKRAADLVATVGATPESRALAKRELARAEHALRRAERARKAGDHGHAALLEAIALEWAECASELARAAKAEARASELEGKVQEADKKLLRAQAMLEQTAARRARATTQLVELESAAGVAPKQEPAPATEPPPPPAKPKGKRQ